MRYSKSHLSFADQASLLLNRGMVATQQELMNALEQVGYYRLSAYYFPFRAVDPVTGTRQDFFRSGEKEREKWTMPCSIDSLP